MNPFQSKSLKTTAISVLDLAKVSDGQSIAQVFEHSKELARFVEELGYKRFWLAEHHNITGIASAATSILIGHIAENTSRIRVGSGGIMLPNHSPLLIAEQFGTLETLYPDRIDLGLGRAPGTDQTTMQVIRRGAPEGDFGDLIRELLFYFAPTSPGQRVRAVPGSGIQVPLYILGSSLYSAHLAARIGRPYAFAGHFAPREMIEAFEVYRRNFRASEVLEKPYVMMGIPIIAAESDERAEFLATSLQQAFLGMVRGNRKFSMPPVESMDSIWTPGEREHVQSMLGQMITGGPKKIQRELEELIQKTGADEFIITSDTYEHRDRLKSYAVIAQAKSMA